MGWGEGDKGKIVRLRGMTVWKTVAKRWVVKTSRHRSVESMGMEEDSKQRRQSEVVVKRRQSVVTDPTARSHQRWKRRLCGGTSRFLA